MNASSITTVQNVPDMAIARRREAEIQLQVERQPPASLQKKQEGKPQTPGPGAFSTYA
jgi:hypothetical protein